MRAAAGWGPEAQAVFTAGREALLRLELPERVAVAAALAEAAHADAHGAGAAS